MASTFRWESLRSHDIPLERPGRKGASDGIRLRETQDFTAADQTEPTRVPTYHPRWAFIQLCITLALWGVCIAGVKLVITGL